jgi:hypothetical protein
MRYLFIYFIVLILRLVLVIVIARLYFSRVDDYINKEEDLEWANNDTIENN